MRISRSLLLLVMISPVIFAPGMIAHSDMITMRDGEDIKGVVLEEYKDRVLISTIDGEKQILKKDIKNIAYDLKEQNYASMGDYYQDRGLYKEAYGYYNRALEINPNYQRAKDGFNHVVTYIQLSDTRRKIDHLKKRNIEEIERKGGEPGDHDKNIEEQLKYALGIELQKINEDYIIADVARKSPANIAGIKKGDVLLEIWGRPIGFIGPVEVMKKLIDPGVMDVSVTIERSVLLSVRKGLGRASGKLGIKLGITEMDGIIIKNVKKRSPAASAGLRSKDVITEVQGESTRYMSLGEVERVMNSRKGDTLYINIERNTIMWKKFRGKKDLF
ncbi:MAG: PDZ domain-containing protein [Candidatus Omnitrophica bacterium]|nr:PDZ domain-containing protein [Candidatus Omnitrophota bacterium]